MKLEHTVRVSASLVVFLLAAACDGSSPMLPAVGGHSLVDIRIVPQFADLRVGDRVTFSASYHGLGGAWTWIVTDTLVARIHPDSGTLLALRPGDANVIVTSTERPSFRAVAPVRVR